MALIRAHGVVATGTDDATKQVSKNAWNAGHEISGATSGGIPYFSSETAEGTSALLAANQLMVGGGVGLPPATINAIIAGPLAPRTYTFPDADSTILYSGGALGTPSSGSAANLTSFPTLNQNTSGSAASLSATNTVARGGTGLATIADKTILVTSAADTLTALAIGAGQSVRRNAGDTAFEAYTPSAGGAALSGITAATGANTIANGNFTGQVWNWANTTNSTVAFTLGETTAATNGTSSSGVPNQVLLKLATLASSTQSPLSVYSRGTHVFSVSPTSAQVAFAAGSATVPSLCAPADLTTGIFFNPGTSSVSITGFGVTRASFNDVQMTVKGNTATVPAITDITNATWGVYWPDGTSFAVNSTAGENARWLAGEYRVSKGSDDAVSYALNFRKSRGTVASPTVITTADVLMTQSAYAYLGATNTYRETGRIEITSAGTISDATTGVGSITTIYGKTQGTDATVQPALVITGGSTATIKFAGTGMVTANGTTACAITAVGPAGASATVLEWLTVTTPNGVRYIPCF